MIIGRVRSSGPWRPRLPAHLLERDPSPRIQPNSLPFQQEPLDQLSAGRGPGAYPSGRIYHPVPWYDGAVG